MGICATEDRHREKISINQTQEESKNIETDNSNLYQNNHNKIFDINSKNIDISLYSKRTIIKTIGQIKGESISIKNNLNCIILIMDYSYCVNILNCQNCSILLAPCEKLINIQNCEGLNIISASQDLYIYNVKNSNFFSFVSNSPIIESSQSINLGNFFIQYMELPEMIINSKLNIWKNRWSFFKEKGDNSDIKYANENIKKKILDVFMPKFPNCYINVDLFQFVPYIYGKSLKNENYTNLLMIIRQEDLSEIEILKMILPEEIESYKIKLVYTLIVENKSDLLEKIIKRLEENKKNNFLVNYLRRINNGGMESLKNSHRSISNCNSSINSLTKSRLNEHDLSNNENNTNNNFKFLKKGDFLFLWFAKENDDFEEIFEYFNNFCEPLFIGKILKEQFNCDEETFKKDLEDIFGFENL